MKTEARKVTKNKNKKTSRKTFLRSTCYDLENTISKGVVDCFMREKKKRQCIGKAVPIQANNRIFARSRRKAKEKKKKVFEEVRKIQTRHGGLPLR